MINAPFKQDMREKNDWYSMNIFFHKKYLKNFIRHKSICLITCLQTCSREESRIFGDGMFSHNYTQIKVSYFLLALFARKLCIYNFLNQ